MLIVAGYWQTTYWADGYWMADYWPEYGFGYVNSDFSILSGMDSPSILGG